MNYNKARASAIKHGMHIQQFCEYADAVAEGAADDIKKEIPAAVKDEVHKQLTSRKVEIEIDKQSMKKAQKAIEDVFAPLKK